MTRTLLLLTAGPCLAILGTAVFAVWRMGLLVKHVHIDPEKRADEILAEAAARPVLRSSRNRHPSVVRSKDFQRIREQAAAEAAALEGGALECAVLVWAEEES